MNYYYKYLKYKLKYLKLRGGNDKQTTIDNIYNYFISSDIMELSDIIELNNNYRKKQRTETNHINETNYTSNKLPSNLKDYYTGEELDEKILNSETPKRRKKLKKVFKNDDKKIIDINNFIDRNDLTYINYENRGKLIEVWLADNMRCPCCKDKTLRRYSNDNFPVIDLICINPNHNINENVKFFQVKSSIFKNNNPFLLSGQPYFSLNDATIMVGSRTWGNYVHNISNSDDINIKKILIGYICILFKENEKNIIIDKQNSFVVLPDIKPKIPDIKPKISDNNKLYYEYTNFIRYPQIKFNKEINSIINLDNLLFNEKNKSDLNGHIIPNNYLEINSWKSIQNPLKIGI